MCYVMRYFTPYRSLSIVREGTGSYSRYPVLNFIKIRGEHWDNKHANEFRHVGLHCFLMIQFNALGTKNWHVFPGSYKHLPEFDCKFGM